MGIISDDKTIQTSVARMTRDFDMRQATIRITDRDNITIEEALSLCDKEWWPTKSINPPKPLDAYEILRWKVAPDLAKRIMSIYEEFQRMIKRIYELETQLEEIKAGQPATTMNISEDNNVYSQSTPPTNNAQSMVPGQQLFRPEQDGNGIVVRNAIVRKQGYFYYIDKQGNVCETRSKGGKKDKKE